MSRINGRKRTLDPNCCFTHHGADVLVGGESFSTYEIEGSKNRALQFWVPSEHGKEVVDVECVKAGAHHYRGTKDLGTKGTYQIDFIELEGNRDGTILVAITRIATQSTNGPIGDSGTEVFVSTEPPTTP